MDRYIPERGGAPRLVFLDLETTGLDPGRHEFWELATFEPGRGWDLYHRNVYLQTADPISLQVGRYYERREAFALSGLEVTRVPDKTLAKALAVQLAGAVVVGINPGFDLAFLERFLSTQGECGAWKHTPIDARLFAVGRLMADVGRQADRAQELEPPFSANWLAEYLAIEVRDRHTALGDVYLAVKFYEYAAGVDMGADWK